MVNEKLFDLEIVNRQKTLFAEKCDFVVVPTTTGEIGILRGHIPLMSIVSKGRLRIYRDNSLIKEMEASSGFIEVTQDYVNILISSIKN